MANALFQNGGVALPPNPGPSALALGAGGVSTSQSAPPTPGFLSSPPLASAPPPKESDLRNVGALLADPLHTQPIRLAEAPQPAAPDSVPYFLGLAGMPSASSASPLASSGSPLGSVPVSPAPTPTPALASPASPAGLESTEAAPLGAPLPSSAIPGSTDFEPRLYAYQAEPTATPTPRQSPGIFDPHAVKRDFPILRERVNGRELVWLDNAATTQKPRARRCDASSTRRR